MGGKKNAFNVGNQNDKHCDLNKIVKCELVPDWWTSSTTSYEMHAGKVQPQKHPEQEKQTAPSFISYWVYINLTWMWSNRCFSWELRMSGCCLTLLYNFIDQVIVSEEEMILVGSDGLFGVKVKACG